MFTTFELEWPWIGLGAAIVLGVLLFAGDALRGDRSGSRWRDPAWLGWLAVVVYLLHNFEEYGVAADGVRNAFPGTLCELLGLGDYPGCAIQPDFFVYVNLGMVWVVAPICALLARRRIVFGFVFYSIVVANLFVHVGGAIAMRDYNPGLLTAVVLFAPASVWAGIVFLQHRDPRLRLWRLLVIVALGAFANGMIPVTIALYIHGAVSAGALNALQVVNALLLLVVGSLLQASLRSVERT